eukprot:TRINITY_DN6164_c0_g2_i3.p1 TRINITY_DN6164_c0_g2~~TRINITY_DN6164_c0_g2_i3.p1  ORF type:complete len:380 (+),score=39.59 TRINITY_DN6164_c0_g2_i3:175-1314(+)
MINGGDTATFKNKLLLWLKRTVPKKMRLRLPSSVDDLYCRLNAYDIELRFYRDHVQHVEIPTPVCYYNFEDYYNIRFFMALEDLSQLNAGEPNGFSLKHAEYILGNVAKLHAKFWNKTQSITKSVWSHGGYWLGPKEMPYKMSVDKAYNQMAVSFSDLTGDFDWNDRRLKSLGEKLEKLASFITYHVHHSKPKTVIHGDYKISNLFVDDADSSVYTIDWQWCGLGLGATDVAYFLYTSVEKGVIQDPSSQSLETVNGSSYSYYGKRELQLLKIYHSALIKCGVTDYPFDLFEQHYLINVLYFCMFCIRQKYSTMTLKDVKRYHDKKMDGLHLRSIDHIKQMLLRSAVLVDHVDKATLNTTKMDKPSRNYFNYAPKYKIE